jgi:hypothetical protein
VSGGAPWAQALRTLLDAYAADRQSGGELAVQFRQAASNRSELPARYRQVLERLLEPLEASALFSEESCAFSRTDLAASLGEWLDAAESLSAGGAR